MKHQSRRAILRQQTADAHHNLDETIGTFTDSDAYGDYAVCLLAFRGPLEAEIATLTFPEIFGDWKPAMIAEALWRDVIDLGKLKRPQEPELLAHRDADALIGMFYVLEGSALGARILYQRARLLGFHEGYGARHLALQADDIGNWRDFLSILDNVEPFDIEKASAAAVQTFRRAQRAFGSVDA